MIRFFFTENYKKRLEEVENFIFETTDAIEQVNRFLDEHDRVLKFIEHNPKTPAVHPVTGDQSWVFGEGWYRLFCRVIERSDSIDVFLLHLIDNRQANLDIYPSHSIPTYEED